MVITIPVSWDMTTGSPLKIIRRFGRAMLATCLMLVSRLPYSSVEFQRTTRRYIPEDRTLHKMTCSQNATKRIKGEVKFISLRN
jgi:hypothetical protein